jgi:hypothetical protein
MLWKWRAGSLEKLQYRLALFLFPKPQKLQILYKWNICQIIDSQLPDELLETASIFHTTCFALNRNPAKPF